MCVRGTDTKLCRSLHSDSLTCCLTSNLMINNDKNVQHNCRSNKDQNDNSLKNWPPLKNECVLRKQNQKAIIVKHSSYFCGLCKLQVERANVLLWTSQYLYTNTVSSTEESTHYIFNNIESIDNCSSFSCFCCKSPMQGKRWLSSNYSFEEEHSQNLTQTSTDKLTIHQSASSATDNLSLNGLVLLKIENNFIHSKMMLSVSINVNKEALNMKALKDPEYNLILDHFFSSQQRYADNNTATRLIKIKDMGIFKKLLSLITCSDGDAQKKSVSRRSKEMPSITFDHHYATQSSDVLGIKIKIHNPPPSNKKEDISKSTIIIPSRSTKKGDVSKSGIIIPFPSNKEEDVLKFGIYGPHIVRRKGDLNNSESIMCPPSNKKEDVLRSEVIMPCTAYKEEDTWKSGTVIHCSSKKKEDISMSAIIIPSPSNKEENVSKSGIIIPSRSTKKGDVSKSGIIIPFPSNKEEDVLKFGIDGPHIVRRKGDLHNSESIMYSPSNKKEDVLRSEVIMPRTAYKEENTWKSGTVIHHASKKKEDISMSAIVIPSPSNKEENVSKSGITMSFSSKKGEDVSKSGIYEPHIVRRKRDLHNSESIMLSPSNKKEDVLRSEVITPRTAYKEEYTCRSGTVIHHSSQKKEDVSMSDIIIPSPSNKKEDVLKFSTYGPHIVHRKEDLHNYESIMLSPSNKKEDVLRSEVITPRNAYKEEDTWRSGTVIHDSSKKEKKDVLKSGITMSSPSNKKEDISKSELIMPIDILTDITKQLSSATIPNFPQKKSKNRKATQVTVPRQGLASRLNIGYSTAHLGVEERMYPSIKKKLHILEQTCDKLTQKDKNLYCPICSETFPDKRQSVYEHSFNLKHLMNLEKLRTDSETYALLSEFMQKSDTFVKCSACITFIQNSKDFIDAHINGKVHKKKCEKIRKQNSILLEDILSEIVTCWDKIQRYCCVLCEISFNYKIEFLEHVLYHGAVPQLSDTNIFDFCLKCATLWLGHDDSYANHCKDIMHKYLVKTETFTTEDIPMCVAHLLIYMNETINELYEQTEVVFRNEEIQDEIKQSLKDNLKSRFPNLEVHFFGSRVTGLGFADSDIDVYININTKQETEYTYGAKDVNDQTMILLNIANDLKGREDEWIVKRVIESSRVPIIKLKFKRTDLDCDISVTNGLSVENSKLIRSFNVAYPPCRKLILFLKRWLSFCNLNGRDGMTNYALAWYVIFFLQVDSGTKLPSIATLIKEEGRSRLIGGWETGVAHPKFNVTTDVSVRELLLRFFLFYADAFDYRYCVACPFMGRAIEKKHFAEPDTLPEEMGTYIRHIQEPNHEYFRICSPMCIQDPFDLSHNLTKAVSNLTLSRFRKYCKRSAGILAQIPDA